MGAEISSPTKLRFATLNELKEYMNIRAMQQGAENLIPSKPKSPDFWDKNFRDSVKKGEIR
jgi:hypothetical protein